MIMKQLTCVFALAFALCSAFAQSQKPDWNATIKVIDEAGLAVSGADVEMSFYIQPQSREHEAGGNVHGVTDTNGLVVLSHANTGSVGLAFQASKVGYYPTTQGHEFAAFKDSDPDKWNPNKTLLLKKIGRPIAMYCKSVNLGMPVFDKPAGFDLIAGDWTAPYGKGVDTDIIFEAHLDQHGENDASYKLTVSFPKPSDGIQEFTLPDAEKGSVLRSPHEAPAGGYQSQWVQTRNRKPGQPETGNLDPNRNFIFRVRTVVDNQGNVVSAHYGKIYGDFLQFRYYLNPTPNSHDIEFDPKQNLLGGIQSFEQVSTP
jgi:hypothetical protein